MGVKMPLADPTGGGEGGVGRVGLRRERCACGVGVGGVREGGVRGDGGGVGGMWWGG